MIPTEVFGPQKDHLKDLQYDIASLKKAIEELTRQIKSGNVYGDAKGAWAGWPPDSLPKHPDNFPIGIDGRSMNYKLGE